MTKFVTSFKILSGKNQLIAVDFLPQANAYKMFVCFILQLS
jgi:hypothetical protein